MTNITDRLHPLCMGSNIFSNTFINTFFHSPSTNALTCIVVVSIQIFTDRPDNETPDERLKPDFIVDYLSRFQRAVVVYLEYLIFIQKIEVI